MSEVEGIAAGAVTRWLEQRAGLSGALSFELVQGGRSNLTYRVTDADGQRVVLRRPPLHGVLDSAHDMGREHRIIAALAASDVPVPEVVGFEPDPEVTGAPFYVMRHVEGVVVRDAATAGSALDAPARARAGADLVDVLVRLHAVSPDEVGLGDLGRREDYLARQLARWHRQLHAGGAEVPPVLDEVHRRLSAALPAQQGASIVHGDYRLDNLIIDPADGHLAAVLDWELTTLGDPLADVGLLQVYWSDPGDDLLPLLDAPTVVAGFPSRAEVAERYAHRSGRDLDELEVYVAFGSWKLACILSGVVARYGSGAYGQVDEGVAAFARMVTALGERALDATRASGR